MTGSRSTGWKTNSRGLFLMLKYLLVPTQTLLMQTTETWCMRHCRILEQLKRFEKSGLMYWGDIFLFHQINGNNLIGCINSWGPLFRVSFDLKINKLVHGGPVWGWSTVIVFKADDKDGGRIPALFIHRMMKFGFYISNSVNGNGNHHFLYTKFHLNNWINFVLEQSESGDGKVRSLMIFPNVRWGLSQPFDLS